MKGIWYLIKVENENDIGTNEIERWKVVDSNPQSVNIGGDYNYQSMSIKCDKGTPAKKETDSAPTNKSLEERVKSLEEWQTQADIEYDANETWKQQMNILCVRKFEDTEKEVKELKTAFEAECDNYDKALDEIQWIKTRLESIKDMFARKNKSIEQQLSELQQAFVKYAICKPTELPQGGEVSLQPPKQSWVNKMNQRIQAAENNVNRRCNKLNQRLQKLESKANGKEGLTAAAHITPGKFVYSLSGDIIAYAVPKSTADEWTHGKPTPPAGSTEQADDPKVMAIEEAERQISDLKETIDKHTNTEAHERYNRYGTIISNCKIRIKELEEWIENQKNTLPKPELHSVEVHWPTMTAVEDSKPFTPTKTDDPKVMTIEEAGRILTGAELKESYKKGWLYKKGELPQEPDIVEQTKGGERRLLELWGILKNKSSTYHKRTPDEIRQIEEYESLYEHLEKLVKIHTKADSVDLVITPANVTYRILKNGIVYEYK